MYLDYAHVVPGTAVTHVFEPPRGLHRHMHAMVTLEARTGHWIPRYRSYRLFGVTMPGGYWELSTGVLEEQPMLLTVSHISSPRSPLCLHTEAGGPSQLFFRAAL